jgi:hypothetical protein
MMRAAREIVGCGRRERLVGRLELRRVQDPLAGPPAGDDVRYVTVYPLGGRVIDPDRQSEADNRASGKI